jgi:hypothetical protein
VNVEPTTKVQTHLYIISPYFLHKLFYYISIEEIIGVHVHSKELYFLKKNFDAERPLKPML